MEQTHSPEEMRLVRMLLSDAPEDFSKAYAFVFERWRTAVFSQAGMHGWENEKDEIFEAVFETFARRSRQKGLGVLQPGSQLFNYFYSTSLGVVKNWRKSKRASSPDHDDDDSEKFTAEQVELMRDALRQLEIEKPQYFACLQLAIYHRLTHREIGQQLGLTESNVSKNLERGRKYLRTEIIEKHPEKYQPLMDFMDYLPAGVGTFAAAANGTRFFLLLNFAISNLT